MIRFIIKYLLIILTCIVSPPRVVAEKPLQFYMNDFYSKSKEASQILKNIEKNLKDGSRKKACSMQREAARLGLLANKSLLRAYELEGNPPPMESINASKRRWESIMENC
tara:strand:+ start:168 stop:497 length:330 start_codon:yes stop_codon:yes gene_type:complete